MKAVFDETNGHLAVFLVEQLSETYHIPVKDLPAETKLGDVFLVEVIDGELSLIENLPIERDERLKANRAKREALLKRKKLP